MPTAGLVTPSLETFLSSVEQAAFAESSNVNAIIQSLVSLVKRRQVRGSRSCAIATAHLLSLVVSKHQVTEVAGLIKRVQEVGELLTSAQPKELAVGNVVRRVLGVIRDEAEENREEEGSFSSDAGGDGTRKINDGEEQSSQPSASAGANQPLLKSMFNLLSHPELNSSTPTATPGSQSPRGTSPHPLQTLVDAGAARDLRAEVVEAIEEIIEELNTADDQIAGYALDHIHSSEIILTHGASVTVQKFLLKAASKRKFTVIHVESFPNDHQNVHARVTGSLKGSSGEAGPDRFHKSLTAAGIVVILIPDSATFAVMSRVNKVVLGTHAVLADGSLVAAAGSTSIAQAASMHKKPVVILSAVYKLSPSYPFGTDTLIEYGDTSKIFSIDDADLIDKVEVENPVYDYVPSKLIDLYITNLGGHAPSYLYRIVLDHYRAEDTQLSRHDDPQVVPS